MMNEKDVVFFELRHAIPSRRVCFVVDTVMASTYQIMYDMYSILLARMSQREHLIRRKKFHNRATPSKQQ